MRKHFVHANKHKKLFFRFTADSKALRSEKSQRKEDDKDVIVEYINKFIVYVKATFNFHAAYKRARTLLLPMQTHSKIDYKPFGNVKIKAKQLWNNVE